MRQAHNASHGRRVGCLPCALCSPSRSLAKRKTIMPVLQGSVCFYSGNWVKKSDCKAREKFL